MLGTLAVRKRDGDVSSKVIRNTSWCKVRISASYTFTGRAAKLVLFHSTTCYLQVSASNSCFSRCCSVILVIWWFVLVDVLLLWFWTFYFLNAPMLMLEMRNISRTEGWGIPLNFPDTGTLIYHLAKILRFLVVQLQLTCHGLTKNDLEFRKPHKHARTHTGPSRFTKQSGITGSGLPEVILSTPSVRSDHQIPIVSHRNPPYRCRLCSFEDGFTSVDIIFYTESLISKCFWPFR